MTKNRIIKRQQEDVKEIEELKAKLAFVCKTLKSFCKDNAPLCGCLACLSLYKIEHNLHAQ